MDLDRLSEFAAVARGGNIKAVAQELGLLLYLGPFLDELNLKYPDSSLELLDDSRYSIEEGLRSGEVDIYFASVMRDFEIPGLTKTTVTASSQYLLLPRFHRLANRTTVSLRELDGECFIPYPRTRENCLRDFQFRNLEASGISCISVSDVPYPAAPCFFYDRASLNEEAEAFVRDYVIFAKEAHRREHRAAL